MLFLYLSQHGLEGRGFIAYTAQNDTLSLMNILFFDGVCHLCNGYINFLIRLDRKKVMYYSALQGKKALEILSAKQRLDLESILYYKNGKVLEKSDAVIESLSDASLWFSWIKISYIIPGFIRDFIYDLVAKNRYKLFGKTTSAVFQRQRKENIYWISLFQIRFE